MFSRHPEGRTGITIGDSHVAFQLQDGQVLQNALFYLLQSVVVLVEYF